MITYIGIKFTPHGMTYTYKTEGRVFVDDIVIVYNKTTDETTAVKVVKVHETYIENPKINYTWIVQRVDFTMHQHRCNEDAQEHAEGLILEQEGHRQERL